ADLRHCLVTVRKGQEIEVRIRHHDILGLAADPATHIDVAECGARPGGVDVQADSRLAFFAVAAATARYVERHRTEVADLNELNIASDLNDLTGDFVTKNQTGGCGGATPHHMLIAPADVRGDDSQN